MLKTAYTLSLMCHSPPLSISVNHASLSPSISSTVIAFKLSIILESLSEDIYCNLSCIFLHTYPTTYCNALSSSGVRGLEPGSQVPWIFPYCMHAYNK